MSNTFIGTSGYHYKHWKGVFYPQYLKESEWLCFYSKVHNSLELNVTFYRLPSEKTVLAWFNQTPNEFIFTLKGSRFITHNKKLLDVDDPLDVFMARASLLQGKLGVILWQFPSNFIYNKIKLVNFLTLLKPFGLRNAFEFRDNSWFNQDVYELLSSHNYSLVIADSPNGTSPIVTTANYLYIRFHGGKSQYTSNYSNSDLKVWAEKINKFEKLDKYIYFNNDASGFAVKNSLYLSKFLHQ